PQRLIFHWEGSSYKTLKPAALAQRAPQVLDLDFNYVEVLNTNSLK
ncbi:hypothetical protein Pse7429DRAFT_4298, partial [Pseudanabaena biceps PCC 7429]